MRHGRFSLARPTSSVEIDEDIFGSECFEGDIGFILNDQCSAVKRLAGLNFSDNIFPTFPKEVAAI